MMSGALAPQDRGAEARLPQRRPGLLDHGEVDVGRRDLRQRAELRDVAPVITQREDAVAALLRSWTNARIASDQRSPRLSTAGDSASRCASGAMVEDMFGSPFDRRTPDPAICR